MQTMLPGNLDCDGCGQSASSEHIARRLQRLEWTTRYRPVHIGTLLLGGISPVDDDDFLYAGKFAGEAGRVLEAAGISATGKPPETVLSEFQRGGFFLAHLLECPLELGTNGRPAREELLVQRVSVVAARVRRSLKPKRIVLISVMLAPLTFKLTTAELGCTVIQDEGKPFGLDTADVSGATQRLREVLAAVAHGK
ncbi:MAG: hypothetical protein WA817_06950 [Candidatus Acidiferrum sp.]